MLKLYSVTSHSDHSLYNRAITWIHNCWGFFSISRVTNHLFLPACYNAAVQTMVEASVMTAKRRLRSKAQRNQASQVSKWLLFQRSQVKHISSLWHLFVIWKPSQLYYQLSNLHIFSLLHFLYGAVAILQPLRRHFSIQNATQVQPSYIFRKGALGLYHFRMQVGDCMPETPAHSLLHTHKWCCVVGRKPLNPTIHFFPTF